MFLRYGKKCRFAHGEQERRQRIRHPKYKTKVCRYRIKSRCLYGERCDFLHIAQEDVPNYKIELCRYAKESRCPCGKLCDILHIAQKDIPSSLLNSEVMLLTSIQPLYGYNYYLLESQQKRRRLRIFQEICKK